MPIKEFTPRGGTMLSGLSHDFVILKIWQISPLCIDIIMQQWIHAVLFAVTLQFFSQNNFFFCASSEACNYLLIHSYIFNCLVVRIIIYFVHSLSFFPYFCKFCIFDTLFLWDLFIFCSPHSFNDIFPCLPMFMHHYQFTT